MKEKIEEMLKKYDCFINDNNKVMHKDGREFKFKWEKAPEIAQDLKAYHGLDGEKELIIILEQELMAQLTLTAGK